MARKRVPAAEARAGMKDLVDAVKNRNERIKITRYGKTVAYLVPARDGEALEACADELEACVETKSTTPGDGVKLRARKTRTGNGNGAPRKNGRGERASLAPTKPASRSRRPVK